MNKEGSNLIVIFSGNGIEAEAVKEMLINHKVMANLKNELMGSIAPWHVSSGGFEPVEVQILEDDKEKALELINNFILKE